MSTEVEVGPDTVVTTSGTITPTGGTLPSILADGSDATYVGGFSASPETIIVTTGAHTLPANTARHSIRGWIRWKHALSSCWLYITDLGQTSICGSSSPFVTNSQTAQMADTIDPDWIFEPTIDLHMEARSQGGIQLWAEFRVVVVEVDQPTFTLQILDGDGLPADPLVLSNAPTFEFSAVALDTMPGRSWQAALYTLATTLLPGFVPFQASGLLWSAGAAGSAPSTSPASAQPNGDYVAYAQIVSTVGANTAFESDIETVGFEIALTIPAAPTVTAVVTDQSVEVCVQDESAPGEWDDTIVVTILRHDTAHPDGVIVAVSDAVAAESEFCFTDCFTPLCAPICDAPDCEAHEFYYTATITGDISGFPVTTAAGTSSTVSVQSTGNHRIVSADCTVTVACMDGWGAWQRDRPNQVWRPALGGLPYVTVGDPGGRDWSLRFAVEQADVEALEALLAEAVFYWSPPAGPGSWLAPLTESVTVQTSAGSVSYAMNAVEVAPPT